MDDYFGPYRNLLCIMYFLSVALDNGFFCIQQGGGYYQEDRFGYDRNSYSYDRNGRCDGTGNYQNISNYK